MTITSTPTRTEGHLRLHAERIGDRTRLTELECHAPIQLLRAHHLDAALPDMAHATVVSPSGGVLQGDHLEISIRVSADARLRVDTPSSLRLYRMPDASAQQRISIQVEEGGLLEFLPEPTIPFRDSRFASRTRCEVAAGGTLILAEVLSAGRAARGEVHQFSTYLSVIDLARPGGSPLARDVTMLEPADGRLGLPGRLGTFAAMGSLYVVHGGFDPQLLRDAVPVSEGVQAGASGLPGDLGGWLKVLGPDAPTVASLVAAAAAAAHRHITGTDPPRSRRP